MRGLRVALLALGLAASAVIVLPGAEAAGYCTDLVTDDCPGKVCKATSYGGRTYWTCEDDIIVCGVRECGPPY